MQRAECLSFAPLRLCVFALKRMTTLTYIFLLPLLAAIALAFVPRSFAVIMRAVAVGVTFVTMLLGILMFCQFNGATADASGYKFVQPPQSPRRESVCPREGEDW